MGVFPVILGIIAIIVSWGIIVAVKYYASRSRMYKLASQLDGPPTIPILGNALLFAKNPEDQLNVLCDAMKSHSSPTRIWLGPRLEILISDPDQLKTILLSQHTIDKPGLYEFTHPLLGTGILNAKEEKWRVRRKLIAPTLNSTIVKSFVKTLSNVARTLAREMEEKVNGPEFDVLDEVTSYSLRAICETALGYKCDSQDRRFRDYKRGLERVAYIVFQRIVTFWLQSDVLFELTNYGKEHRESVDLCHEFTRNIIEKKRKQYLDRDSRPANAPNSDEDRQNDEPSTFLDLVIHELSDEALCEEVDTMVAAGNDTVATALSFISLILASYPHVQEKVYREIIEICGESDRDLTPNETNRLEYLDRVIKESLRVFPPAALFGRVATKDVQLGDITLPKGTSVVLGVIHVHRDEKYWTNPLEFDPDRFLPGEQEKRHPFCYIPFSAGPRNCIGTRYAMVAMKIYFATILRKFVLKKDNAKPVRDIELKLECFLRTMGPNTVRIERRSPPSKNF